MANLGAPTNDFNKDWQLLATLDLCNCGTKKKPVYQFVYGSELYGTLFGVFARFTFEEANGACKITSAKLKLFNYQGMINIGFTDDKPTYDRSDNSISFIVQGTAPSRETEVDFSSNPIPMEKNDRLELTFRRVLRPLPGFVNAVAASSSTSVSIPHSSILSGELFDSEFCYRSGDACYRQPLRPGMEGARFPIQKKKKKNKKNPESVYILFPSHECFEGVVNVIY